MTEHEDKPVPAHPSSLLLPWYVNGTLSAAQRGQVDSHLSTCAACREELASISHLREQARTLFEQPPSPSARSQVMSRIQSRKTRPRALDQIAQFFQDLLAPKWAPAALMLVIVGQFAGLGWLATRSGAEVTSGMVSRDVPTAVIRLQIIFNPAASQRAVQVALRELGGHIINGPTPEGALMVELNPDAPQAIAARIRRLRDQPHLVQSINSAPP